MDDAEIHALHDRFWKEGYGTVSAAELIHFRDVIAEHRPASFVEVGTASGLSGGIIATILGSYGGSRFVTVDWDNTFFGDTTKENGFLIPLLYEGTDVTIERRSFMTSLDVGLGDDTFDMGFVDANHQHPWPLIDTLALNPALGGSRVLLHDDLNLFRHQPKGRGIGPKVVFDQFPHTHRTRFEANHGNTFSVSLAMPHDQLELLARDGLATPWTLTRRLDDETLAKFRSILDRHYTPGFREFFDRMCERYNHPTGNFYSSRPDPAT